MFGLFVNLPLHIMNFWLAVFAPRAIFKIAYSPSSEAVRSQEEIVRNKMRYLAYVSKKIMK